MDDVRSRAAQALDIDSRLSLNDAFHFACGPHVACFTECCGKLQLLLTPYDLLRLRRRLRVSSAEFLDAYTETRLRTAHGFPEVLMRFDPAAGHRCPFVTPAGCSVYEDRPGACRIYPLGRASTMHPLDGSHREFYFTVREDHCRGFELAREWKVREWIADQGLEEYNTFNDLLMELYVLRNRRRGIDLTTRHFQMFMMSCYNMERFREFVFRSGFLNKFQVEPDLVAALTNDDEQLLRFAFQWLRFALFHEPTLIVKQPPA